MDKIEKNKIKKKYHLDKSHSIWQPNIDNWYAVEAFRLQTGKLPNEKDAPTDTVKVLMDFLDNKTLHYKLLKERDDFGSIFLSAKRALFRYL